MSYRFSPVPGKSGRLGLVCPAVVMAIYYSPPQLCQEARRQSTLTSMLMTPRCMSRHVKSCTQPLSSAFFPSAGLEGHLSLLAAGVQQDWTLRQA